MQGSVIKAEITEQVRLLKEEWRVTVEKMSKAMAEVRSTLFHAILSLTISAPLPYFFHTRILTGATFWLQNVAHGIERGSLAPCFATCLHLSELCSSVFHAHTQLIASLYADEGLGTEENKITSGGARGAPQTTAAT
jgi:hypothetical protein